MCIAPTFCNVSRSDATSVWRIGHVLRRRRRHVRRMHWLARRIKKLEVLDAAWACRLNTGVGMSAEPTSFPVCRLGMNIGRILTLGVFLTWAL